MKTCSKCGETKPRKEFFCDSAASDGRRPSCKECDRKHRGRNHRYRRRPELAPEGQRWCLECEQFKPCDEFGIRTSKRMETPFYDSYCLNCRRNAANRSYQYAGARQRAAIRDRTYGLEPGEYDSWLSRQGGRCAICRQTVEAVGVLAVDHDHAAGECRGLLCANCNKGLGHFKDDQQVLQNAILYLQRAI